MQFFNHLSISTKLFIFLLIPLLPLLFFAGMIAVEKQQQLQSTEQALHFTYIAQELSTTVYYLQKERGLSAGLLGNQNKEPLTLLARQRVATDAAIAKLTSILITTPSYLTADQADNFQQLNDELKRLNLVRQRMEQGDNNSFFNVYSDIINKILNVAGFLEPLNEASTLRNMAASYLDILWLEEYSGQERGALNGVFSTQQFSSHEYRTISSYIASQAAAIRHFYQLALPEHRQALSAVLNKNTSTKLEYYREIIFNRAIRNDALSALQSTIGYGGFIHDFKNYVIRGEKQYQRRVKRKFQEVEQQIKNYRLLPKISTEEEQALNTILNTLQQYQNNLTLITQLHAQLIPIDKIDDAITVDDRQAIKAIVFLRHSMNTHNPTLWWKIATQRLDGIHQVGYLIINDLITALQQREQQIKQSLYLYLGVTFGVILLSIWMGLKLRSRLVLEIKSIAETMRSGTQKIQLLSVSGQDEIAEMANAFNSLIIEREKASKNLSLSRQVFLNAHEGIIITDVNGHIVDVNPTFCAITGYTKEEVLGKNPSVLSSGKHNKTFYKDMWDTLHQDNFWQNEVWNRKKNGQIYPETLTISVIKDEQGDITHYVALFSDISNAKQQQQQLEFMAHYDVLTQLPNRSLLADRFLQAQAHSKRQKNLLAVCFIDLDDFKPVNDAYGHNVGDQLLIEVAARIKNNIRDEDTASRQGGDEFVLLLGDITSFTQCEKMLNQIIISLANPYQIDRYKISISASIGVTLYPNDPADFDTLMRHADQAMYQAKLAGRNRYSLFNTEQNQQTIQRHIQLEEIEQAYLKNQLCLFYQPKVNMITGRVVGAEALIRWQHPEKGLIPPLDFLPVIADTELEVQIGCWVINEALRQLNQWNLQGIDIEISVNISSYHLQSPDFIDNLDTALALYPAVNSHSFQLEILESSALGDLKTISSIIRLCINRLGVSIALDDFGTGYSSLTHMRHLSAQTIKIDQSFVRDMLEDTDDYAIIDGVIALAHSFNRDVIAEGVETTDHGLMLLLMGCELVQGYGVAKPMPAEQMIDWLSNYHVNEAWQLAGACQYTAKEISLQRWRLSLKQWQQHFEFNINASASEIKYWPVLRKTKCHCGVLIKQAKQVQLFDPTWLQDLELGYEEMHKLANVLFEKYQQGFLKEARAGLKELNVKIEKLFALLEQGE